MLNGCDSWTEIPREEELDYNVYEELEKEEEEDFYENRTLIDDEGFWEDREHYHCPNLSSSCAFISWPDILQYHDVYADIENDKEEDYWSELHELVSEEEQRFDDCRLNPMYGRYLDMGFEIKNEEDFRHASLFKFLNVFEARDSLIQKITKTGPYYRYKYIEMIMLWIKTQQTIDITAKRTYEWFASLNKSLSKNSIFDDRPSVKKAPEWKTFVTHWPSPTFQTAVSSLLEMKYSQPNDWLIEEIEQLKEEIQTVENEGERKLAEVRKQKFPEKENETGGEWFRSLGGHWKLNNLYRNQIKENKKIILELFIKNVQTHSSLKEQKSF